MTTQEYELKVYEELVNYLEETLTKNEIEYTKEYLEDYGLKYELLVEKLGKIRIIIESVNECRRSSKSNEVDILSFFCHFYDYHNEDKQFDQRFNIRSGKYNLHTMSIDYEKFLLDAKRVINIITMNSKQEKVCE